MEGTIGTRIKDFDHELHVSVDGHEKSDNPEWQVSAAEFVRSFAKWRDHSIRHPVQITTHGRVSHVLSSQEYWDQLTEAAASGGGGDQSSLFGLADWVDEAIILFGEDEEIIYANRVAKAVCRHELPVGAKISDILPRVRGSLMEVHYRRTLSACEPTSADLPSPFRDDAWLHFRCYPLRDNCVLMFRDITEEVRRHRLADVKEAMVEAISMHGGMGYVRLSVRGTIDRADDTFCNWVGLSEERLTGVQLAELVATEHRARFRSMLENVLSGRGSVRLDTCLIPNREGRVNVQGSMVQLHGAYGAEGAVVVFSPNSESDA